MPQSKSVSEGRAVSGWRLQFYRIGTVLVSTLLSLVLGELALRAMESRKARHDDSVSVDKLIIDPELGKRLAPNAVGHDANGFRNESVPERVDIVAIGDSQTWGMNARRADAWPQQLGRISGRSVYNMGLHGYGPVQYSVLVQRGLKFSPKVIIIGVYLGNDLYDSYCVAYANNDYDALRDPRTSSALMQNTARPRALNFWDEQKYFHKRYGLLSVFGLSYWLRGHTASGRALNDFAFALGADVDFKLNQEWSKAYPEHGAVYATGNARTVFHTAYRFVALDLNEPRIAEGLRITRILLPRMRESAEAKGAKLLVLLIPTKESVYAAALEEKLQPGATFAALVQMEARARAEIIATCRDQSVECVDVLPPLSEAIKRGEAIYPSSVDEHFEEDGYHILATTVNDALAKLHW